MQPGLKTTDRLRPTRQRDSPLVDELAIQAVHEQATAQLVDSLGARAERKAVLHAKHEPLDGG